MPLPNYFTLGNAFFGFMALFYVFAAKVDPGVGLRMAGFCILLSAAFDFLDGFVARLTSAESLLGKELDSLSDLLSFGVAPAMIIFKAGGVHSFFIWLASLISGLYQPAGSFLLHYTDVISAIFLFPLVGAGIFRLARFNVEITDPRFFTGLPITATGMIVAFFAALGQGKWLDRPYFAVPAAVILSWLMVSRLKIRSLKKVSFNGDGKKKAAAKKSGIQKKSVRNSA